MRSAALIALLGLTMGANAQMNILRSFLALNAKSALRTAAGKRLLAEEAVGWPDSLGRLASKPDRLVRVAPDFAAARVQGLNGDRKPVADLYFYLRRKAGIWDVVAFRALARTGIIEMARDELLKKKELTSEESRMLLNAKLVLSSDHDLCLYFSAHRPELETMASRLKGRLADPVLTEDLKGIGFSTADRADEVVRLAIGGILDDTVGFLKVQRGGRPPIISPHKYIWLEPLSGGWYLFKTT